MEVNFGASLDLSSNRNRPSFVLLIKLLELNSVIIINVLLFTKFDLR